MNALFRRRIYKPFGLLQDRLMTARHYRTLKTALTDCDVRLHRPLSISHDRVTCLVYCSARRHLNDDVRTHKDRFESAADGRWSNRCNCCGLNSKGSTNKTLCFKIYTNKLLYTIIKRCGLSKNKAGLFTRRVVLYIVKLGIWTQG